VKRSHSITPPDDCISKCKCTSPHRQTNSTYARRLTSGTRARTHARKVRVGAPSLPAPASLRFPLLLPLSVCSVQYAFDRHFDRVNGCSLFSGLRSSIGWGRPDFMHLVRQTRKWKTTKEGSAGRSKEGKTESAHEGRAHRAPVGLRVRVSVSLSCLLLVIPKRMLVCLPAVVRACSPMCRRRAITSMHSKDHTSTIMQNSFSEGKQDWIETRMEMKRTCFQNTRLFESTRLSNRSYNISLTTCAHAQRGEFGLPKAGNRGGKSPMRGKRESERKGAE
jgi:hypothetical protein